MDIEKDYYRILEISHTATQDEIKRAYRLLARRYHPDTSTEPRAAERFYDVQTAYEILGDERRRLAYDKSRAQAGLIQEAVLAWDLTVSRQTLPVIKEDQVLYMLVEISPAVAMEAKRLPLNLCLVLDRSTSMQGQRIEQVKAAAYQIIDDLREEDAFSIISFSDRAEVVVPSQWGGDRKLAKARLHALKPSGQRHRLAEILPQPDAADRWIGIMELTDDVPGVVGASIVDEDELVGRSGERFGDLL